MTELNTEISELIRVHFPDLTDAELQKEIATVGILKSFSKGEVIMGYGSYIRLVPLIVKGSIKVVREDEEDGRELLLYYLNKGETCSMSFSCCMMNKQSDIRTTAMEDSTMIAIPIKHVDEWMSKYPSWKRFVMSSYDMRMHEMIKTIDNIAFKKMDERLLKYLKERFELSPSNYIESTHQEIADDLNASRESVSRLLKQLEKAGVINLERNKIQFL